MINKQEIIKSLQKLGVKAGDILNLKVSVKSIGEIEGGISTLLEAFIELVGKDGTLVCDSFVEPFYSFLKPIKQDRVSLPTSKSYAGYFANYMLQHPEAYRSTHPVQAFTAIGKKAKALTEEFNKNSAPYGFLRKMADLGAKNLRVGDVNKVVGVGTTHVAICELGFWQLSLPKGIYYKENGEKKFFKRYWANGCPKGFNNLIPLYYKGGAVLGEGKLGDTETLLTSMSGTLKIEKELFVQNPSAFLCNDKACTNCSFTWENSKYSFTSCLSENLKRKKYDKAMLAVAIKLVGHKHI